MKFQKGMYICNAIEQNTLISKDMKTELRKELAGHILEKIKDGIIDNKNKADWHFHAFNEDFYIIGNKEANDWLKRHEIDVYDGIAECNKYEKENFGEIYESYKNSEMLVNMLAYIYGESILKEFKGKKIKDLQKFCEAIINE